MDFTDEQHTLRYPASEKPGEAGIYKRFATNPHTGKEIVHYCLFEDGWWYEGGFEPADALTYPMRKSHFQDDGFEWCGVMPGSYERTDVQEVKVNIFAGNFFGTDKITAAIDARLDADKSFEPKLQPGDIQRIAEECGIAVDASATVAELEAQAANLDKQIEEAQRAEFAASFFGGQ